MQRRLERFRAYRGPSSQRLQSDCARLRYALAILILRLVSLRRPIYLSCQRPNVFTIDREKFSAAPDLVSNIYITELLSRYENQLLASLQHLILSKRIPPTDINHTETLLLVELEVGRLVRRRHDNFKKSCRLGDVACL